MAGELHGAPPETTGPLNLPDQLDPGDLVSAETLIVALEMRGIRLRAVNDEHAEEITVQGETARRVMRDPRVMEALRRHRAAICRLLARPD